MSAVKKGISAPINVAGVLILFLLVAAVFLFVLYQGYLGVEPVTGEDFVGNLLRSFGLGGSIP